MIRGLNRYSFFPLRNSGTQGLYPFAQPPLLSPRNFRMLTEILSLEDGMFALDEFFPCVVDGTYEVAFCIPEGGSFRWCGGEGVIY